MPAPRWSVQFPHPVGSLGQLPTVSLCVRAQSSKVSSALQLLENGVF